VNLKSKDLLGCINESLEDAGLPNSLSYLANAARTTILYIDGLDELTIEKQNKSYVQIDQLVKTYPDLRVCIAIRSAAYKGQFSYMRELTLAPFDSGQINEFILKWHSFDGLADKGNRLILMIESNQRLAELATKPLFLNLICNAHRRYLDLSQRPSALFSQCIDTLMWDWDARRDVQRSNLFSCLDIEKKRMIHARIASEMHSERTRFWKYQQITSFLRKELPRFSIPEQECQNVLEQTCSNHCVYVKHTEDCFGFTHNALQEYLTAEWLKYERRWASLVSSSLVLDSWWEHVIYLTISSMGDATEALAMLYENENIDLNRRLWLSANCLKFDPVLDPAIREMITRRVLSLYHNGNPEERNLSLSILAGWRDEWTSEIVKRSLGSQLPGKENWAAWE
jgi:predicted NACHT family NTPase